MIRTVLIALVLMGPATPSETGPPAAEEAAGPAVPSEQSLPAAEEFLGRRMPLSLQQAEFLALQNNLDLELARAAPAIADEEVQAARGAFDPRLSAEYRFNRNETPSGTGLFGAPGDVVGEDEWNYSSGFNGILPFGMTYSSGLNQRRWESEQTFASYEREWRATWRSELTLPLLKDLFHNDANVAVKRSRVAREISNEDFRSQLTDLIVLVDEAYWELAAARAEERVTQKSLQTAEDLLEQTRVQYEVGVVSKVNVTQAEAGVAEREVEAIVAKNRAAAAQDDLLNIVLAPGASDFEGTELLPKDPAFVEYEANLEAALENATRNRPELAAARQGVQDAKIQLAFAENQRLPSLDLSGVFQLDGLSGHPKDPDDLPPGATPPRELGGAGDAFDEFFTHDGANTWEFKANMSIPLGNRTARAQVTQRKIELRRARTSLRNEEQKIVLEVRNAVRNLKSALEALEAAERRRIAQEETLRAEQEKLRLGDSTPHDVLEFEEDLAEAETQEITALQAYRNAITALERGQATLLPTHGISVETELRR